MAVETNVLRDEELLDRLSTAREGLLREIRKAIKGQDEVVEQVLLSLFVGGHSIITGVPGLAKTLLVRTIASVLDLSFKRIQFTPDLMPADITGTEIIEEDRATGRRAMEFIRGPRSEEHTSELQSRQYLVCRLLLEKKKTLLVL